VTVFLPGEINYVLLIGVLQNAYDIDFQLIKHVSTNFPTLSLFKWKNS
jgi:hypothetical protein